MSSTSSPYRDFAENLRALSVAKGSIAQACRDLGMNRQQFNKYLSGTNLPGPATLEKIAKYFGVEQRVMFHYTNGFAENSGSSSADLKGSVPAAIIKSLSASRDVQLREGCYAVYFPWIHGAADVVRSIMVIFKVGEVTCFRRYTLFRSPNNPKTRFSHGRHDGIVLEMHGRIFFIAQNTRGLGEISLVSFGSTTMPNNPAMTGLAMVYGLTEPIAARVTVEYFGRRSEFRKALRLCGIMQSGSPEIPLSMKISVSDQEIADSRIISPFGMFDVIKISSK